MALRDLIRLKLIQHWTIDHVLETAEDGTFTCSVKQKKYLAAGSMRVAHGPAIRHDGKPEGLVTRTSHLGSLFVGFVSMPTWEHAIAFHTATATQSGRKEVEVAPLRAK
jgi:hypothetical protein